MAELKQSEVRLMGAFGILIAAAITFFVLGEVNKRKDGAEAGQRAIRNKIAEYNELIREKDKWEVRREFVQRFQPAFRTEEQEAPALEAYFRRAAEAEGVEIKKLLPQPPAPVGDDMMSLPLTAIVSGTGPQVIGFLVQLQAEDRFYSIPSMSLEADRKDPTLLDLNLIFQRLFTLNGEELYLEEEVPSKLVPPVTIARQPVAPAVETSSEPPALIADPAGEGDAPKTPVASKGAEESADTKAN